MDPSGNRYECRIQNTAQRRPGRQPFKQAKCTEREHSRSGRKRSDSGEEKLVGSAPKLITTTIATNGPGRKSKFQHLGSVALPPNASRPGGSSVALPTSQRALISRPLDLEQSGPGTKLGGRGQQAAEKQEENRSK